MPTLLFKVFSVTIAGRGRNNTSLKLVVRYETTVVLDEELLSHRILMHQFPSNDSVAENTAQTADVTAEFLILLYSFYQVLGLNYP